MPPSEPAGARRRRPTKPLLAACHVERSETSLAIIFGKCRKNDQRFFASLRMTMDTKESFTFNDFVTVVILVRDLHRKIENSVQSRGPIRRGKDCIGKRIRAVRF